MKDIIHHIDQLCKRTDTKLVIVTKMRSDEAVEDYYQHGYRDFGENKVQEIMRRKEAHDDIRWHMIGRLQTNKVKEVVRYAYMLHSLNRYELIDAIEKEAAKQERIMPCLLQFNIAEEESKSGFKVNEFKEVMEYLKDKIHIRVCGLMCMGPHVEDVDEIRRVFHKAKELFEEMKAYSDHEHFDIQYLSMGMSSDYEIAIEEGSNMIRVGTVLF